MDGWIGTQHKNSELGTNLGYFLIYLFRSGSGSTSIVFGFGLVKSGGYLTRPHASALTLEAPPQTLFV